MENEKLTVALRNLEEVNKVISTLDPAIKLVAFEAMRPLIVGHAAAVIPKIATPAAAAPHAKAGLVLDTASLETFFAPLKDGKPKDNVFSIMAWLYSQYGVYPVLAEEIKAIGNQVGLIIPSRVDMTFKASRQFTRSGKGFQPTVQGELAMKEKFGITKGTQSRQTPEGADQ